MVPAQLELPSLLAVQRLELLSLLAVQRILELLSLLAVQYIHINPGSLSLLASINILRRVICSHIHIYVC